MANSKIVEPAVAVVTGASAGVGRAVAVAFARRGYKVALLARGSAGLAGACREVQQAGAEALVIQADVGKAEAVFAAAAQVVERWGRIDVWVNNAMATVFGPADRVPPNEWQQVTQTDYLGTVFGTLAALQHMRKRNRGTIVQVGSALAYRAIPLQAPYCAAKFAIRGFTDSLRSELKHDRSAIRLTMVQLPAVNTPQFEWSRSHMRHRHRPLGPWYQPEPIAAQIVRAAQRAPREMWLGQPAIRAILGSMLIPGFLDRYLASHSYRQQISPRRVGPDNRGVLFGPAAGDHGTHGPFDAGARTRVIAVVPMRLQAALALCALAIAAAAAAAAFFAGRRRV